MREESTKAPKKGIYILPNLLTTASLFAGFMGIIWTIQGNFEYCALAIFASCIFDSLDGKIARLTNTASEFGVQYDSLCDLVSFGVAPALMAYQWALKDFERFGLMACFLYLACGALRLARFNIQTNKGISKKYFVGMPIPGAACILASFLLFSSFWQEREVNIHPEAICLVLVYLVAILMVSRVRYASFKEFGLFKTHPLSTMVTAILIFVLIATRPKLLIFCMFFIYLVFGILDSYIFMPRRLKKPRENPVERKS